MQVWVMWHGGSSYSVPEVSDAKRFRSLRSARDWFEARPGDSYTPCVSEEAPEDGGPEAWIFFSDPRDCGGDPYPDRIMRFGRRGGVRVERC